MDLRDELIAQPYYTLCHSMHTLHIPLGQFRVGTHRLRVEANHQIDHSDKIYQLCHLQEVKTKEHFILYYPIHYKIRGWFHCLFKEPQTLSNFFRYLDQQCLILYM